MEELYLLLDSMRERQHSEHKFMAALKGVDLDEGNTNNDFDRIKQQAAAELAGKSEDEYVFDLIGIQIEEDDD